MNATDLATTVAAWGGLALGVAGIVHSSIVDYVAHRKKLHVFFQRGAFLAPDGKEVPQIFIAVVNVCERPITVTHVWAGLGKLGESDVLKPTLWSSDFKARGLQLLQPGAFAAALIPGAPQDDAAFPGDLQCFAIDAENRIFTGDKLWEMDKDGTPTLLAKAREENSDIFQTLPTVGNQTNEVIVGERRIYHPHL